jgi:N-methylhydantoinase B
MNRTQAKVLDPITLEILYNALRSVTDETYIALMKSAYSTNIKERCDHSTAIIDPEGRLILQAENSIPVHIASMVGLMKSLLGKYEQEDIREGDLFMANDPHVAGGTHLPDINMAMPIFVDGRLLCFMCNIAHHADMGGMAPGSMAGGMSEIYQEGLRVPVVKLFSEGTLQDDLFDLVLLNVRLPDERRGDYFAQVAACRLGDRRLREIAQRYSLDMVQRAFSEIIARTERRMREAISQVPDGHYTFTDVMDDDGLGAVDIPIKLVIEVEGNRIRFDFSGSAPQVQGNINANFNATQSAVCYTVKALLDPEVPNNQGVLDVCEIVTEKGSIVDCVFPAAVAARCHTCQRIVDVIIGALADALPDKVVGAANGANTTAVFSGIDPDSGAGYLYLETLGGGFGGRSNRDGKDGVQVHMTNTSNLPVEAIEMEYPLIVESYGLIPDSGGAGEFRGGLALRRVIRPVGHTCVFNGAGERFRNQPWGLFGGGNGSAGRFVRVDPTGHQEILDGKPSGVSVQPDERIVVETPGAGGYGPSSERTPERLADDRESRKFSAEYMRRNYGS